MAAQNLVHLIDQQQFNKYAAAWSHYVSHHQDLTAAFQQADGSQLRAMCFSFQTLEFLLSTVGARRIKAQFLLKKDDQSGKKLFTLALYATDALDGRVSAYYLAQYLPLPPAPPKQVENIDSARYDLSFSADNQADYFSTQIPNALVHAWLDNWKQASLIAPAMFSSNYGPLTGYTFDVGDFLDSFFYATAFTNKELLVLFGLHQHYPAFPDCYTLKQTFGLVLRIHQLPDESSKDSDGVTDDDKAFLSTIQNIKTHTDFVQAIRLKSATYDDPITPTGQPFYDYSQPSPPN